MVREIPCTCFLESFLITEREMLMCLRESKEPRLLCEPNLFWENWVITPSCQVHPTFVKYTPPFVKILPPTFCQVHHTFVKHTFAIHAFLANCANVSCALLTCGFGNCALCAATA